MVSVEGRGVGAIPRGASVFENSLAVLAGGFRVAWRDLDLRSEFRQGLSLCQFERDGVGDVERDGGQRPTAEGRPGGEKPAAVHGRYPVAERATSGWRDMPETSESGDKNLATA